MSIRFRGLGLSKKALLVCFALTFVLGAIVTVALFAGSNKMDTLNVEDNNLSGFEYIDNEPLVNSNGWNVRVMSKLNTNLDKVADNMALVNASGLNVSSVIVLGGIEWGVVYKQNNIITLLANENVANLPYSSVADFLNTEFYRAFCDAV